MSDRSRFIKVLDFFKILNDSYFRCEFYGKENLPSKTDTPIIFFANHSGNSLPWDGIMLTYFFHCFYGDDKSENSLNNFVQPVYTSNFHNVFLMQFFFIKNFEKFLKWDVTDNVFLIDKALGVNNNLLIFPEGTQGIGKGFSKRYQLQEYKNTFLYQAIKHQAVLVPVSIVNAEFLNPFSFNIELINKMARFFLKIPFLPISPILILLCFFPFVWSFALPAKMIFVIHKPFKFEEINTREITKNNCMILNRMSDFIRVEHQKLLNQSVRKYHAPYDFVGFFVAFLKEKNKMAMVPIFWINEFWKIFDRPLIFRFLVNLPVFGYFFLYILMKFYECKDFANINEHIKDKLDKNINFNDGFDAKNIEVYSLSKFYDVGLKY